MLCLSKGLTSLLAGGILSGTLLAPCNLSTDLGDHIPTEKYFRKEVTRGTIAFWVRAFVAAHLAVGLWCWSAEGFALLSYWTEMDNAAFLVCSLAIALRAWCLKELRHLFTFEVGIRRQHK